MPSASAFCPGHITGFFEIRDQHPEPLRRGSRGAGFSVAKGAISEARVEPARRLEIEVEVNGVSTDASTTRTAIQLLLGDTAARVEVSTELQLPVGQGFGMSGAGAYSTTLALANALQLDDWEQQALEAAHIAEVARGTGLGDVAAQRKGGFEFRELEGPEPHGSIGGFEGPSEVVLCVLDEGIETKGVLGDPGKRERINRYGASAVADFRREPCFDAFANISRRFAEETGLLGSSAREALDSIQALGSMAMLGGSIFAFGDADDLASRLEGFGTVHRCWIDPDGARIL